MTRLAVVIAAYNEEETIEPLTRRLHRVLSGLPDCAWEILYVVEGRDRTREILAGLAAELGGIRVLYEEEPGGLGNAFRRGFAAVPDGTDLVVTLDADLNHQPEEIPRLLEAFRRQGCDILVGSRFLAASRVEGTPAWKRFLSGATNVLMRWLYGLRVRDKTSGFRVYRAEALRALSFDNANFAFLPELLIRAHQEQMTLCEEPIHFVFRSRGSSKMRFWTTSVSYLSLLRARFDRWSVAALLLLLTALAVRTATAFPLHKYPADADSLLSGLCAFKVLRGDFPVFFSATRIGAFECYLAAGAFILAGPSRGVLLVLALILDFLFVVAAYLFTRELLGRRVACLALLFLAIPSPSLLFWTYVLNGYPTVMLTCAVVLWLAARLGRKPPGEGSRTAFFLGLAAGFGVWHSIQTLGATAAAGVWLLWRRRGLLRERRLLALAAAGAFLGAVPLIAYNIKYPLGSLRGNYAARPAGGVEVIVDNAAYFLTYSLPELVASTNEVAGPQATPTPVQLRLRAVVLAIYAAAFLFFLLLPLWRRRRGSGSAAAVPLAAWALLLLVFLSFAAINLLSAAGQGRGPTVRFVLPMGLAAVPILALFVHSVGRRSRGLAAAAAGCVVTLSLLSYSWPWSEERQVWADRMAADEELLAVLRARQIDVVAGGYWTVYPVAFLSRERIVPLTCEPEHDHYGYNRWQLGPRRWALVSYAYPDGRPTWIHAVQQRTGLAGTFETRVPGYLLFFPAENPPSQQQAEFLERLRSVCQAQPY